MQRWEGSGCGFKGVAQPCVHGGQVTICQYLCGDSKAMHGGGRGEQEVLVELWVRAGTLQTELLLCACTEEAEEPVQSCVCSCWVSIFPVFPF